MIKLGKYRTETEFYNACFSDVNVLKRELKNVLDSQGYLITVLKHILNGNLDYLVVGYFDSYKKWNYRYTKKQYFELCVWSLIRSLLYFEELERQGLDVREIMQLNYKQKLKGEKTHYEIWLSKQPNLYEGKT